MAITCISFRNLGLLTISTALIPTGIAWAQPAAIVDVDAARKLKVVNRQLFGANVEWFHDGDFIWDAATQTNRKILVDRAKEMGVSLLRFPGGTLADFYHWRNGIGPRKARPVSPHGMDGGASPNNFGLHEFMDFCAKTGAAPLLQVNVVTGTADEAQEWVAYSNANVHAERAANGAPAPFGVRLWEIGNEQYLRDWDQSSPPSLMSARTYAGRFIEYTRKMKLADPSIKVGAVSGHNFGSYQLMEDPEWTRVLLQRAAPEIDFLAVHNGYAPFVVNPGNLTFEKVYEAMLAFPAILGEAFGDLNRQIEMYAPADASRIELAVTEWGPLFGTTPDNPFVGHAKTLGSGVFTASMIRTFLLADRVTTANIFQLTEPLFMGTIGHDGVVKPTFLALKLFSRHFGTTVVDSAVSSPGYFSPAAGLVDQHPSVPYVESVSSLSDNGKTLFLILINKHLTSPMTADIRLRNFKGLPSTATVRTMTGPSADANNGNDLLTIPGIQWALQRTSAANSTFYQGKPDTVKIVTSSVKIAPSFQYTLPPVSVIGFEIKSTQ